MEYLVKLVSPPGNCVILDPFMGSGTTCIACSRLGIYFVGIEKNKQYFNTAVKRINDPYFYNCMRKKSKNNFIKKGISTLPKIFKE